MIEAEFQGKILSVSFAKPGGGSGGSNGCFKGQKRKHMTRDCPEGNISNGNPFQ